jgi:hypothetical protein
MHELMLCEQQCKPDMAESQAREARTKALQAELIVVHLKHRLQQMEIKCPE